MLNIFNLLSFNSDSFWGIFLPNFFNKIFFSWGNIYNYNSGAPLSFPIVFSQLFQYLVFLFFGGVSNIFVIFLILFLYIIYFNVNYF